MRRQPQRRSCTHSVLMMLQGRQQVHISADLDEAQQQKDELVLGIIPNFGKNAMGRIVPAEQGTIRVRPHGPEQKIYFMHGIDGFCCLTTSSCDITTAHFTHLNFLRLLPTRPAPVDDPDVAECITPVAPFVGANLRKQIE
eukprot:2365855-Amphidinium_carterae.1